MPESAGRRSEARPLPECATIAIGTVPHTDPGAALDFMLMHNPVCPSWPQLPRTGFHENMYVQYAEGMPAAVIDEEGERLWFETEAAPEALAEFYERYLAGDVDLGAISPSFARGFEPLIKRAPSLTGKYIKGQVTGPASFGLTVADQDGKPVLYHADLFEAIVKALALKGRWQAERFRRAAPHLTPIVFFDEPYLTQVGSAMISLPPEQIRSSLNECFGAIDGLTGIHVCGGTDWGLIASTEADILHFDAADHMREFLIYERELADFMETGGLIAWGIAPTNESARERNAAELVEKVMSGAAELAGFCGEDISREEVLRRSFISESCGTGTLEMELAERCFQLAEEVACALQREIC